MVCEGVTGRLEVARYLIHLLNKEDEIDITPVSSDFLLKNILQRDLFQKG